MNIEKEVKANKIIYPIVFLLVILLAAYFFHQARFHQQELRSRQVPSVIDASMPIGFVINQFGISEKDVLNELQLPDIRWNKRLTIFDACTKNKLDCELVVDNLNKKISK